MPFQDVRRTELDLKILSTLLCVYEWVHSYSNTGSMGSESQETISNKYAQEVKLSGKVNVYKNGLITTSKTLIITAIMSFERNSPDSKTIEPLLNQMKSNIKYTPQEVVYDRGGKGQKQIGTTKISTPDYKPLKRDTEYQKRSKRKKFRRRAAIKPVIGHLKTAFRMTQNYLSGSAHHKSIHF